MNFSSRSICARCKTIPYEKGTETVSACDGKVDANFHSNLEVHSASAASLIVWFGMATCSK
jgi:hypothetical protein